MLEQEDYAEASANEEALLWLIIIAAASTMAALAGVIAYLA